MAERLRGGRLRRRRDRMFEAPVQLSSVQETRDYFENVILGTHLARIPTRAARHIPGEHDRAERSRRSALSPGLLATQPARAAPRVACVGLRRLASACVGLRRPASACVGLRRLASAWVGYLFTSRATGIAFRSAGRSHPPPPARLFQAQRNDEASRRPSREASRGPRKRHARVTAASPKSCNFRTA